MPIMCLLVGHHARGLVPNYVFTPPTLLDVTLSLSLVMEELFC